MDYKVPDQEATEFGERVNAMLRTTWSSWQIAQQREQDVWQQLREREGSHATMERPA